ncbi:MAG: hypothetical protein CL946_12880 [Ectothiorhodospiraceae bacterium]|nr:hypothetical protein [Ectothiorhodospiraceae bacterium]
MPSLTGIIEYLSTNPLLTVFILGVIVGFVIALLRKLFKAAVLLLILIVVLFAAVYHFAGDTAAERGRQIMDEIENTIDDL